MKKRRAGLIGALVGATAAGVAAGMAAERYVLRRASVAGIDPYTGERFGQLPHDESLTVTAPDGVDLYVEIVEPADGVDLDLGIPGFHVPGPADPTIVFVHGFCLDMGTFHFQRKELTRRGDYRMVFYDQPGHGKSSKIEEGEYSLDDLGAGLKAVLDETVPEGPVVLVGHSMGGMTIMALAEQHPELFGERIKGVVLISTSAGKLEEVSFGLSELLARFRRPLLPLVANASRVSASVVDRARHASTDLAWMLTRRYGFGVGQPSRAVVSYVERMNSTTPMDVIARYLRALYEHARFPALEALKRCEVLAICGDHDALTPVEHSQAICKVLHDARLVVVEGGGHVALLERPDEVNAALVEFLERIQ